LINATREKASEEKDWSIYNYPEQINTADEKTKSIIEEFVGEHGIEGIIEYCLNSDFLLFNYHTKTKSNKYNNSFIAVDVKSRKKLMEKTLNKNSILLYNDSFFIYKNFLFLLKEKNEVNIFMLE